MTLHQVRVTNDPDKVLEVDDGELLDLERLGLLVQDEKPVESVRREKAPAPAVGEKTKEV